MCSDTAWKLKPLSVIEVPFWPQPQDFGGIDFSKLGGAGMGGEEEEGDDEEEDDDMPALEGEDEEGEKAESSSKAKIEEVN